MSVSSETSRLVQRRAQDRCEYCLMHQALQGATFHIEHIIPRSLGGRSANDNLCLACPGCNLQKSDRIAFADPHSGRTTPLFNPRLDNWRDHFAFEEFEVVALTDIGHATMAALNLNHERRVQIRRAESLFGLFPPAT